MTCQTSASALAPVNLMTNGSNRPTTHGSGSGSPSSPCTCRLWLTGPWWWFWLGKFRKNIERMLKTFYGLVASRTRALRSFCRSVGRSWIHLESRNLRGILLWTLLMMIRVEMSFGLFVMMMIVYAVLLIVILEPEHKIRLKNLWWWLSVIWWIKKEHTKSRSEVPLIILGVTVCLLGVEAGVSLGVLPPFDVLAAATNFSVWIYSSILPMDSFLWEFWE